MTRVVVVGLDGAGFQLLGDWFEDGTLPTLSALRERGRWAKLRSSYPPVTCPAWRCYSTGLNPGKLGVFWWEVFDRERREFTVPTAESFTVPDLWDHLGRAGFESAVVNMSTTHPPRPIDGWLVTNGGGDGAYTAPETLREELEREVGYRPTPPHPISTLREHPEHIDDMIEFIDTRFDAARYLRETYDPDFLHLTLFLTNGIQHYFWDDDVLRRLWTRVDANLGEFIEGEENVLVMSDHGSNRIETVFNINSWLEERGYLVTKSSATDYLHRVGIDREAVVELVDSLGLASVVKRYTPAWVLRTSARALPDGDGSVQSAVKHRKIDWTRSRAVASGQGPVYVLADGPRREQLKSELKQELAAVTAPDGSPVAREVLDAEAVYEGPYVEDGPDLIVDMADHVHIPGVVGADTTFVEPEAWKWKCENHRDGLFIAAGPDVAAGGQLSTLPTLYDLAPTILHWFDCPVPTALDGAVLDELFPADSDPGSRAVRYDDQPLADVSGAYGRSDRDELREQLTDLGYLS